MGWASDGVPSRLFWGGTGIAGVGGRRISSRSFGVYFYDGSFVQKLFSARAESSARALKPNSIN